jgi:hypothetical protein
VVESSTCEGWFFDLKRILEKNNDVVGSFKIIWEGYSQEINLKASTLIWKINWTRLVDLPIKYIAKWGKFKIENQTWRKSLSWSFISSINVGKSKKSCEFVK